jgi:hypothetical protein
MDDGGQRSIHYVGEYGGGGLALTGQPVNAGFTGCKIACNTGLSRTLRAVTTLCRVENAGTKELKSGTTIHGPLQHL